MKLSPVKPSSIRRLTAEERLALAQPLALPTARRLQNTWASFQITIEPIADANITVFVAANIVGLPGNTPAWLTVAYVPGTAGSPGESAHTHARSHTVLSTLTVSLAPCTCGGACVYSSGTRRCGCVFVVIKGRVCV